MGSRELCCACARPVRSALADTPTPSGTRAVRPPNPWGWAAALVARRSPNRLMLGAATASACMCSGPGYFRYATLTLRSMAAGCVRFQTDRSRSASALSLIILNNWVVSNSGIQFQDVTFMSYDRGRACHQH